MNKRLYLASSIADTARSIAQDVGGDVSELKLAFIDTAAEVEEGEKDWLENDKQGLVDAGFDLFNYTIKDKNHDQIEEDLAGVDVIHVNGGNTFYLLLQSRKSGFDEFSKQHVEKGKIYIGSSAGSIVASPDIGITRKKETKEFEEKLEDTKGLNLVDFIILPHWGQDYFKSLYLGERMKQAYNTDNKIILLTDNQYVKVDGECLGLVDITNEVWQEN